MSIHIVPGKVVSPDKHWPSHPPVTINVLNHPDQDNVFSQTLLACVPSPTGIWFIWCVFVLPCACGDHGDDAMWKQLWKALIGRATSLELQMLRPCGHGEQAGVPSIYYAYCAPRRCVRYIYVLFLLNCHLHLLVRSSFWLSVGTQAQEKGSVARLSLSSL